MLPFLKKKSKEAAAPLVPAWHPNFRNAERLPDIKVIRTSFFVNGTAITIMLALVTFFVIDQWQLRSLKNQIADAETRIARDQKPSTAAKALFTKFQAEEVKFNEVEAFLNSRPVTSPLFLHLAKSVPSDVMALDIIDLRPDGLTMRLSVRGRTEVAIGRATAFLEKLKADAELKKVFDEVRFATAPAPNPATGRVAVEFFMRLKDTYNTKK
jgi:hypothetical protein